MITYAHCRTFVPEGSGASPQCSFKCLCASKSKIDGLQEHLTLPSSSPSFKYHGILSIFCQVSRHAVARICSSRPMWRKESRRRTSSSLLWTLPPRHKVQRVPMVPKVPSGRFRRTWNCEIGYIDITSQPELSRPYISLQWCNDARMVLTVEEWACRMFRSLRPQCRKGWKTVRKP